MIICMICMMSIDFISIFHANTSENTNGPVKKMQILKFSIVPELSVTCH